MRRLLPTPSDDVDLDAAYAYPSDLGGRAWVRANMVCSADGSAQVHGRSGDLGTPADKLVFGVLRGLADVVLVGSSTAKVEGYRPPKAKPEYAERRAALGQPVAPALGIVSLRLDLTPEDPMFAAAATRPVVVTSSASDAGRRAALSEVADVLVAGDVKVDLAVAMARLAERGLPRVLCEGGPTVLAEVCAAGVLDELCLTISPLLVGGEGSRVLRGDQLEPPLRLSPAHLLEEDGTLLARLLVQR